MKTIKGPALFLAQNAAPMRRSLETIAAEHGVTLDELQARVEAAALRDVLIEHQSLAAPPHGVPVLARQRAFTACSGQAQASVPQRVVQALASSRPDARIAVRAGQALKGRGRRVEGRALFVDLQCHCR